MKKLSILALLFVAGACGASINGPATNLDPTDRCGGHLDCGAAGCCWDANLDGSGYQCNEPGSKFGACAYVGLSPDVNGVFSSKLGDDAGTPPKPLVPTKAPPAPEPSVPPPVRHDGQG
jgi:hypothetical protein